MRKIKNAILKIWKIMRQPEMLILPGNLAFFLVLSLVPIISLFGIIASILSLSTNTFINLVYDFFPSSIVDIVIPFIDGSNLSANSIIFTFIGFFLASNGPDSLIVASNLIYKKENKGYIYRRIKASIMTFLMLILFVFILLVLAFGNIILNWLSDFNTIGTFIHNSFEFIVALKFLVAFSFIFIFIKLLYTIAPDASIKSRKVNVGAFFATLSIMLVTAFYSYYVTNIARYDIIYGNLSNIIISIFFVYIISYIIVLGIAINAHGIKEDK